VVSAGTLQAASEAPGPSEPPLPLVKLTRSPLRWLLNKAELTVAGIALGHIDVDESRGHQPKPDDRWTHNGARRAVPVIPNFELPANYRARRKLSHCVWKAVGGVILIEGLQFGPVPDSGGRVVGTIGLRRCAWPEPGG